MPSGLWSGKDLPRYRDMLRDLMTAEEQKECLRDVEVLSRRERSKSGLD